MFFILTGYFMLHCLSILRILRFSLSFVFPFYYLRFLNILNHIFLKGSRNSKWLIFREKKLSDQSKRHLFYFRHLPLPSFLSKIGCVLHCIHLTSIIFILFFQSLYFPWRRALFNGFLCFALFKFREDKVTVWKIFCLKEEKIQLFDFLILNSSLFSNKYSDQNVVKRQFLDCRHVPLPSFLAKIVYALHLRYILNLKYVFFFRVYILLDGWELLNTLWVGKSML